MSLSFRLGISVQRVLLGTCLVAFYQRIRTWLLGIQCLFWFCVQARCLVMFPLLPVLLTLLVSLNVRMVPPLEISQSCSLVQRRPVITGLVSPLEVVRDFLWLWAPLDVSRGEQADLEPLNVGMVPPLEVFHSCSLVQRRPVITGLVSPFVVVRDFLWRWAPLDVSRGEQVVERTMLV